MRARLAFFALLSVVALVPLQAAELIWVGSMVMKPGDDAAWSRPDLDDSDWEAVRFHDVPDAESILWLRGNVTLHDSNFSEGKPLGILISALASHEIWWDGVRIGRGGIVGATAEQEKPGPIQAHYVIPDRLATLGAHTIAIRVSALHRHFRPSVGYWSLVVGEYDRMIAVGLPHTGVALISLSGIVMMALLSIWLFLLDRRDTSFLVLGLLCLTAASLLVAESWRSLFGYTYNWHLLRLVVVTALSWLLDLLLLVFLARRFPMTGSRWFVAIGVLAATLPVFVSQSWDPKALAGFIWVFALSTAWCLRAVWCRLHGSVLAAVGVAVGLGMVLWEPSRFLDSGLYLSLDVLLVCLLASHVLQVRSVRQEREAALLRSARLEIELLRKHIQPHFLMNTLTALTEWIDQEPRVASQMIQALAEEFRMLSDISHRRLICMEDEIRLCRTHLEIMSRRKKREFHLATDGVDTAAAIPPAVIHTLVENAITHGRHSAPTTEFRLTEESRDGRRCYLFRSPLGATSDGGGTGDGTGLRYIRARLRESFGDDWTLVSRIDGEDWLTEILVPAGA